MFCPKCGSGNVTTNLYKEEVGSKTITTTNSQYKEKGHGCMWWLLIGWWWWIVDLCIWLVAFIPRLIVQLSKKKKYTGKSVSVSQTSNDTIYRTVCVCNDCGNNWISSSTSASSANTPTADTQKSSDDTPFYKTTWFFIVCCIFLPFIAIPMVWLMDRGWDKKTKITATVALSIWLVIFLISGAAEDPSDTTITPADAVTDTKQVVEEISSAYTSGSDIEQTKDLARRTDKIIYDACLSAEGQYNTLLEKMADATTYEKQSEIQSLCDEITKSMDEYIERVDRLQDKNASDYILSAKDYFSKIKKTAGYLSDYLRTYDDNYLEIMMIEASDYNNYVISFTSCRLSYLYSAGYTVDEVDVLIGNN